MSNVFGSMSGYGRNFDSELQAKIDKALAGKASAQDKIQDFMKKDLGIDPDSVPMTGKQARVRINTLMQERSAATVIFTGNSLGIKHVEFVEAANAVRPCTTCSSTDVYEVQDGTTDWHCYNCDNNYTPAPLVGNGKKITQNDKEKDWSDMMRCYKALQVEEVYSFSTDYVYSYRNDDQESSPLTPIQEPVEPDPRFLSVGLTVRLRKQMLNSPDEFVYAKKGSLFNDSDVVLLPSMQPITDLSSWTVVEVL